MSSSDQTSESPANTAYPDTPPNLIDIETNSMERCADFRSHFYKIGEMFHDIAGIDRHEDHESRVKHDARVVRVGREYLKYCRPLRTG
jgi:hypothetical protein